MCFLSKIPNLILALFMSILAACGTQQEADSTSARQKKTWPVNNSFANIKLDDSSLRKNYAYVKDPTGLSGAKKVHQFKLDGICRQGNQSDYSDCFQNSVRTELYEDVWERKTHGLGQPDEAWYSWKMYVPADFDQQSNNGRLILGQFKSEWCPHVTFDLWSQKYDRNPNSLNFTINKITSWEMDDLKKGNDCQPAYEQKIADLREMKGKWTTFELHTKWSETKEGFLNLYINGDLKVEYAGSTQLPGTKQNYFKFGMYNCCNYEFQPMIGTTYFTPPIRSQTRVW